MKAPTTDVRNVRIRKRLSRKRGQSIVRQMVETEGEWIHAQRVCQLVSGFGAFIVVMKNHSLEHPSVGTSNLIPSNQVPG